MTDWTHACPCGNVRLSGTFIESASPSATSFSSSSQQQQQAQQPATSSSSSPSLQPAAAPSPRPFQLSQPIHIEHASLVAVAGTSTARLRCLNCATDCFATTKADSDEQQQVIDVPGQLSEWRALLAKQDDDLWSGTFHVLLDGPDFAPPRFEPPTGREGLLSPTLRSVTDSPNSLALRLAALSPVLSPQRRATSQASDASVPPLQLPLARRRAVQPPASAVQPPPDSALTALLALIDVEPGTETLNGKPSSLAHIASARVSDAAVEMANEIVRLRREHDVLRTRLAAECDVLDARAAQQSVPVSSRGRTLRVSGFAGDDGVASSSSQSRERSVSRERSPNRDGGLLGETSAQRGRERRPRLNDDARTSDELVKRGEQEERERGRTGSRSRGREADDRPEVKATRDEPVSAKETTASPMSIAAGRPQAQDKPLGAIPEESDEASSVARTREPSSMSLAYDPDQSGDEHMFEMDEDARSSVADDEDVPQFELTASSSPARRTSDPAASIARDASVREEKAVNYSARSPMDPASAVSASSPQTLRANETSAAEDGRTYLNYVSNDKRAAKANRAQYQTDLASEAPSHRPLAGRSRRRRPQQAQASDESSQDGEEDADPRQFVPSSAPISIGFEERRKQLGAKQPALGPEEGSHAWARGLSVSGDAPMAAQTAPEPDAGLAATLPTMGSSYLAQSLRNPPTTRATEEAIRAAAESGRTNEDDSKAQQATSGFVPPHEWAKQEEPEEYLYGTSPADSVRRE